MHDKAMVQMQQTGIINENVWLVLGPFDNIAGIGYNTEDIPDCGLLMWMENLLKICKLTSEIKLILYKSLILIGDIFL